MLYNKVILKVPTLPVVSPVAAALKEVDGVVGVEMAAGSATVTYDPDIAGVTELCLVIEAAGHRVGAKQFVMDDDDGRSYGG